MHQFFCGDMNYRVDSTKAKVEEQLLAKFGHQRSGSVVARGKHVEGPDLLSVEDRVGRPPPAGPWVDKESSCRFCDAVRLCTFRRAGGEA